MTRHLGLVTRVKRIERRARSRRKRPGPFVFAIYEDEQPGPILGLSAGHGLAVTRNDGEDDFATFCGRAATALGRPIFMFATYADREQLEAVVSPPAPPEPAVREIGPYDVGAPGIGRHATPDELRRMGHILRAPECLL